MEIQVEVTPDMFSDKIRELEGMRAKLAAQVESVVGIRAVVTLVEPYKIERSKGKAQRVFDKRET